MTWPHFARFSDERPGRQNVSVWPQINGFGMDFETGGIRFAPTLPAAWGEVRLGELRYKDMTLHITLKGEGSAIRSFEINGKSATEPFVSAHLRGQQDITILLGQRPEPRTPPIHPGQ
jgi:trehalose/maltose hydrolase-like predicted phosphorylase